MAFVMLTRRNVAALKSSLIRAFPEIRSTHADEALAAGIGFRTHAALLAALKVRGRAQVTVVLSEKALSERLRELSGIEAEGRHGARSGDGRYQTRPTFSISGIGGSMSPTRTDQL